MISQREFLTLDDTRLQSGPTVIMRAGPAPFRIDFCSFLACFMSILIPLPAHCCCVHGAIAFLQPTRSHRRNRCRSCPRPVRAPTIADPDPRAAPLQMIWTQRLRNARRTWIPTQTANQIRSALMGNPGLEPCIDCAAAASTARRPYLISARILLTFP
jgi:hypothetical protein